MNKLDLTGQRFGRLAVIREAGRRNKRVLWECLCDCGNTHRTTSKGLRDGLCRSCGCLHREKTAEVGRSTRKHGHSGRPIIGVSHSSTYGTWLAMKARCYLPTSGSYHNYGAKGITVCKRWRESFEAFLEDMGEKPTTKHSIDRIDGRGNYEPSNCRWATWKEQRHNRVAA